MKIYSSIKNNFWFWESKVIRNIKFFDNISSYIISNCMAMKIIVKFILKNYNDNGRSRKTRKLLEDYYREDKDKLEELMNRNLSEVWFK